MRDELFQLLSGRAVATGFANEGQEALPLGVFLAIAKSELRQLAQTDGAQNRTALIHNSEATQERGSLEKVAFERLLQWPKAGQVG